MQINLAVQLGMGFTVLIVGLKVLKDSLYQSVNDKLELILNLLTGNLFIGVVTGIVITMIIQSSSATIALVIALLNAGILSFRQGRYIVIGANIGTTVTVQIFSWPLEGYVHLLLAVGLGLYLICYFLERNWLKYIAQGLVGFGILFFGLRLLEGLIRSEQAVFFLHLVNKAAYNPLIGILAGGIITAIIQSSSALTGVVVALAKEEAITLSAALAVALGSNIGTCITAFIASVGTKPVAKKLAYFHLFFNLVGGVIIFIFLRPFGQLVSLSADVLAKQVANAHTIFNIFTGCLFILLEKNKSRNLGS